MSIVSRYAWTHTIPCFSHAAHARETASCYSHAVHVSGAPRPTSPTNKGASFKLGISCLKSLDLFSSLISVKLLKGTLVTYAKFEIKPEKAMDQAQRYGSY